MSTRISVRHLGALGSNVGFDLHLVKPVTIDDLAAALEIPTPTGT